MDAMVMSSTLSGRCRYCDGMTNDATSAPTRGVLGLLAAIVGAGLMTWGFLGGINSALDGSGSGASPVFSVLFFVGALLVLVALVWSIVRLVRGRSRALAALTLVVCLLPVIAVIILRVAAMTSV
jgi:hypothetical protein